jgi:hypothetical protein
MGDSILSIETVKTVSHMFIYFHRYMFWHLWNAIIKQCKKKADEEILFIHKLLKLYHNNGLQLEINPSITEGYTLGMVNFKVLYVSLSFIYDAHA